MELEIINKLFLELAQVATTKTKRELELEEKLRVAEVALERTRYPTTHRNMFRGRI